MHVPCERTHGLIRLHLALYLFDQPFTTKVRALHAHIDLDLVNSRNPDGEPKHTIVPSWHMERRAPFLREVSGG